MRVVVVFFRVQVWGLLDERIYFWMGLLLSSIVLVWYHFLVGRMLMEVLHIFYVGIVVFCRVQVCGLLDENNIFGMDLLVSSIVLMSGYHL